MLMIVAACLLACGGCPIDGDLVVTETLQAALNAATTSFVDALGQFLAGN